MTTSNKTAKMPRNMDTIQLSPAVLDWAASQAGQSLYEFAKTISKRNVDKILDGILTNAQVVKFAKKSRIPLGYLFLEVPPPARQIPIADFRTVQFAEPIGRDFFDTYDDIEYKQSWYKEILKADGVEPLPFVGKFTNNRPATFELAKEIRAVLNFSSSDPLQLRTPDELFSFLAGKCEQVGILVFKNGVVGNNTKRPISVNEFRGFAIADSLAPVIFINGADAPAAWVFTLAHELAHIWIGASGISDAAPSAEHSIEKYCNAVAAEFLVPADIFLDEWNSAGDLNEVAKIEKLRITFKVSRLVIARRGLELGVIDRQLYKDLYDTMRLNRKRGSSGGDFYRTLATRNSKKLSMEITNLAIAGHITLGQAGKLLNTNPNHVVKFYAKQNSISV